LPDAQAQDSVKFDASQPNEAHPVKLRGDLYKPQGDGVFPAVILMHGCGGWQPAVRYTLQDYANDFRNRGFVTLNLDSFGSRYYDGDEMCMSNAKLRDAIDYRTADAYDAGRYLRTLNYVDGRNVFLMGQSNGGSVVTRAALASSYLRYRKSAAEPAFRGAVAFYPWCGMFVGGGKLASALRIFSGGRDNWVSAAECQDMHPEGAEFSVVVYPDAPHSFDLELIQQRYAGFLVGKDKQAAESSRRRMFSFMHRQLTPDQQQHSRLVQN
jgi:dienelactone hydrolase